MFRKFVAKFMQNSRIAYFVRICILKERRQSINCQKCCKLPEESLEKNPANNFRYWQIICSWKKNIEELLERIISRFNFVRNIISKNKWEFDVTLKFQVCVSNTITNVLLEDKFSYLIVQGRINTTKFVGIFIHLTEMLNMRLKTRVSIEELNREITAIIFRSF